MKKTLSLLVALVMTFGILMPTGANAAQIAPKIDLKQAIETVKNSFGIDTTNFNFTYNYNENNEGRKTYDMNWNSKKENQGGLNATVDADTGDILNMNRWTNESTSRSKIPAYSKEQALNAAKAIAAKLQPDKFKEMKLKETPQNSYYYIDDAYSTTYNFYFVRTINNIEFQENGINIGISKNSLTVMNYNFNWDSNSLPDATKAMNIDAAKKIFQDKLGLELSYNLFYKYNTKEVNTKLVYSFKNNYCPIDAVTGEVLTGGYYGPMYDGAMSEKYSLARGTSNVVTPEEQNSIDDASKYITKEQAVEIAQKYLPLNSDYKLSYSYLNTGIIKGTATWSLSWDYSDSVKSAYGYMSAQIDAVKGEIKGFSIGGTDYEPKKDANPSYTKDAAKDIAEKFIKELYPDRFSNTEYKNYDNNEIEKPTGYNFNYIRRYNNASCPFDYINVYVDAYTGKIREFNTNWTDISLPSTDGAISLDNAYSILYNKSNYTMKYIKYYNYKNGNIPQIRLAYVLDNYQGVIDAKTGNILDYNGDPVKERKDNSFTDIKGNPAENSINILNQLGLLNEETDKFMPDKKIAQKDFIKMLVLSVTDYYEVYGSNNTNIYDKCYDIAIQRKIITEKEKKPEAAVTRQDAAKMIVKAMGLGFVANLSNIYKLPLKDIKYVTTANVGYIAIASELKILVPVKGYFYPTKEITRGDTAIMLVNYLKINTAQ